VASSAGFRNWSGRSVAMQRRSAQYCCPLTRERARLRIVRSSRGALRTLTQLRKISFGLSWSRSHRNHTSKPPISASSAGWRIWNNSTATRGVGGMRGSEIGGSGDGAYSAHDRRRPRRARGAADTLMSRRGGGYYNFAVFRTENNPTLESEEEKFRVAFGDATVEVVHQDQVVSR